MASKLSVAIGTFAISFLSFLFLTEILDHSLREVYNLVSDSPSRGKYDAPLRGCETDGDLVPSIYLVHLRPGTRFEKHREVISKKINPKHIAPLQIWLPGGIAYAATINKTELAIVRADRSAVEISCELFSQRDMKWEAQDGELDYDLLRPVRTAWASRLKQSREDGLAVGSATRAADIDL